MALLQSLHRATQDFRICRSRDDRSYWPQSARDKPNMKGSKNAGEEQVKSQIVNWFLGQRHEHWSRMAHSYWVASWEVYDSDILELNRRNLKKKGGSLRRRISLWGQTAVPRGETHQNLTSCIYGMKTRFQKMTKGTSESRLTIDFSNYTTHQLYL